ncbi:MAG: VOC family protein [Chloroflexi bacterium]|nr:VOC family protein [Chloroflexota bacterium]
MLTHLDHLVILVTDLPQAVDDYTALGFTVTPGGTHADGLTHNALITFADSTYLELIAFVDPASAGDNTWGWRRYLDAGGGLIDYCVASDDLTTDVERLQAQGFTMQGPTSGGRKRPDGQELRWLSASFWQAGRELPFLIQDLTPRELRVPGGAAAQHANGVTGIHELTIVTADLDRSSGSTAKLTDSAETPFSADRRRDAQVASFTIGAHTLVFAEPANPHSPLQAHIEAIGLGPYEITLASESDSGALLDRRLTHGVEMRIA